MSPFIDSALRVPVAVYAAIILLGLATGLAYLVVTADERRHARRQNVRPGPRPPRARSGEESSRSTNPGRDDSPIRRVVRAYRRHQSWRRAAERELGIRNGRLR